FVVALEQMLHSRDQVLRLKWFAYKFVCLHRKGLFCDGAIHHARHQNHRRAVQLGMLLDALTDFVAILVGHDHVGDHNVGSLLLDVGQSGGRVGIRDHVDVLTPKRDLDYLAHGGTVVDEYNGWGG